MVKRRSSERAVSCASARSRLITAKSLPISCAEASWRLIRPESKSSRKLIFRPDDENLRPVQDVFHERVALLDPRPYFLERETRGVDLPSQRGLGFRKSLVEQRAGNLAHDEQV